MKSTSIVFDAITVKREPTFAFDVWYANHYLRPALASGAFMAARRYASPIRGSYLALFELADATRADPALVLNPTHPLIASVERYVADDLGEHRAAGVDDRMLEAEIAYPVFFRVPAEREQEFNAWYDEEHMNILLRGEFWRLCRRFRVRDPGPDSWTHIALHYLTDLRALESKERDEARATPWRARLAQEAWFKGEYRVYYRYGAVLSPE